MSRALAGMPLDGDTESSIFGLINGLPVHPLVVHAAVVFVPLTALGLVVMALWPRFSARHGWLVVGASVLGVGFSLVAKESGEQLEDLVGEPGFDHAELGDVMWIIAGVLAAMTIVLWLLDRRRRDDGTGGGPRVLRTVVAIVAVLVAIGNMVWIYRVGDSGAKSVWSGEVASAAQQGDASGAGSDDGDDADGDDDSATASPTPTTSPATAVTFTLADVATHDSPADCWAAIDGGIYDLTAWIDEHPGGPQEIERLCGADGSSRFDDEHGGEQRPEDELATFRIGTLRS